MTQIIVKIIDFDLDVDSILLKKNITDCMNEEEKI